MGDCELPDVCSHSEPIARKEHQCCECDCPIRKNERYFYCFGKWPGVGAKSYRQHLDCESACELVRDHFNDGDCIAFGALFDWWGEIYRYRRELKDSAPGRRLRAIMAGIIRRRRYAEDRT